MSKKSKKLQLITLISLALIIAVLVYCFIVFYGFMNRGISIREKVGKTYAALELPHGMKLQEKIETGDPIDSPDFFGYEYRYTAPQDKKEIFQTIGKALTTQGFKVREGYSEGEGYTNEIVATSKAKNLHLSIVHSPGILTIQATELESE